MSFTTVTLVGTYTRNGVACTGQVSVVASDALCDTSTSEVESPHVQTDYLINGAFSIPVIATDDSTTSPSGVTYTVTEAITGSPQRVYSISVPSSSIGGILDLATCAPAVTVPTYSYALSSDLVSEAAARVAGDAATLAAASTVQTNLTAEVTRATTAEGLAAQKANNLSDLASAATARTNLGLGSAATQASSAFDAAGAAAAVQTNLTTEATTRASADTSLSGQITAEIARAEAAESLAMLKANNLSDIASPTSARANLGLGSAATLASSAFDAAGAAAAAAAASLPLAGGTMTGATHGFLDYNGTVYNVKAWGATGNGTTDDTTAIQNCINSAVYGATVYFPKGTYLISSTLQVQPFVRYRGSHRAESVIKQAAGANLDAIMASPFWYASAPASADGPIDIESLGLNGNRANQTGGLGHGVILITSWHDLYDLEISNCYGDGLNITCASKTGAEISSSAVESHISRVDVRNCGGIGIHIYCPGGASYDLNTDGWLHDCIVQNPSGVGISIDSAGGWDISGNHIYGCPTDGIVLNNSFNTRVHHNYVETWGTAPNVIAVTSGSNQATYTQSNVFSQPALRVGSTIVNGTGTVPGGTTVTSISSTPTTSGANYVWTVTLSANATGSGNTTAPVTYYAIAAGTGAGTFAGPNYGTVIDHNTIFQAASGVASVNSVTGIIYTAYNGSGQVFMVNIEGNTLYNFFSYWVALKINMQSGGNGTINAKVDNNNYIGWASRFTSSMASGQLNITGDVYGSAISTSANDGFARLPGTAGTPTGTPETTTGIPIVVDTANQSIYGYVSGAWTQLVGVNVSSFNTRTGAVTLTKADVTGTGLAAADVGADASGAAATAQTAAQTYADRYAGSAAGTASRPLSATDASVTNSRAPSGSASGDLGGTYPGPSVQKVQGVAVTAAHATLLAQINNGLVRASSGLPATALAGEETVVTGASTGTLTLPSAPQNSTVNTVLNLSSGAVTLAAGGADTINNFGTTGSITIPQYGSVQLVYLTSTTTWYCIDSNLTSPNFLLKSGGTMSGAIAMGANKVTGLANGSAATDAAAFGQVPQGQRYVALTATNQTFSVPAGVTKVRVRVRGGGGGGGGGGSTSTGAMLQFGGGGGGPGEVKEEWVTVTAGGTLTATIGAGGSAGTFGASGGNAGGAGGVGGSTSLSDSSLGTVISAVGGTGGAGAGASSTATVGGGLMAGSGLGATSSTGANVYPGGGGPSGSTSGPVSYGAVGGGGGGAASATLSGTGGGASTASQAVITISAKGVTGASTTAGAGTTATTPGCGGGGGGGGCNTAATSYAGGAGGAGAPGLIEIWY